MSLDKRSTAILMQLINADSYLSVKELTERLNVSRRTIYYDLDKINHWLDSHGLDRVEQVRSAGFILSDEAKSQIPSKIGNMKAWHYEYSASERKAWIALYLLAGNQTLYLDHLMEKVRVSRNTTLEDIKVLKAEIERFNLQLESDRKLGYMILGEEADIRRAIIYYLSIAIPEHNWQSLIANIQMQINASQGKNEEAPLIHIDLLNTVYRLISESEKKLNIRFTDDFLHSLSLRLVLFSKRIAAGKFISMDTVEKEVLRDTKAFEAATVICQKLELAFQTTFPQDEIFYLTTHLLGAKLNQSGEDLQDEPLSETLKQVASLIVDDFQKYACILFQDRELLVKNLLLHLKPAYYRVKYGLEINNDIVKSVKSKYQEVFSLTQKVIHHFEELVGKRLHDNEVAYIAIHFGGWMRKEGATPASRKQALIVCANGVGTSQILKQQLEGLFSTIDIKDTISVREYEEKDYDVDLVISTTSVTKKDHPIFIVNPILTDAEKESLLKKVNVLFNDSKQQSLSIEGLLDVIERHAKIENREKLLQELKQYVNRPEVALNEIYKPDLLELLTDDTVQFVESVNDWRTAISLASEPLLTKGIINQLYIDEMIHNVEIYGPYIVIAPNIAIPHAKPEHGVNKLGMSLLRINEAVAFSEQPRHKVQFIVVLATIDNESHLKALSQLTRLFSTEYMMDEMVKVTSKNELLQLMKNSIS